MSASAQFASTVPVLDGSNWLQWSEKMKAFLRVNSCWQYCDQSYVAPVRGEDAPVSPEPTITVQPPAAADQYATEALFNTAVNNYNTALTTYRTAMATWRLETYQARADNKKLQDTYDKAVAEMTAGNEKALGLITLKVSENLYKKIGDSAYDTWELFKSEFGVTGAATIYLDWIKLKEFAMVPGHPPAEQINQLRYLINKLEPHFTLPESLQTLILLGSLPSDWRQNFQTLLMTLKPTELTLAHVIP